MVDKLLTPEETIEFREWEKLFDCDGWTLLTREIKRELDEMPEDGFRNADSYEKLVAMRVRARVFEELLAYPAIIRKRKEDILYSRQLKADMASEDSSVEGL